MSEPVQRSWVDDLADSWDRIADRLEENPQGQASPFQRAPAQSKAVATTTHALAKSLREAARLNGL